MLKLNLSMSLIISPVCSYLNTSHVKVKLVVRQVFYYYFVYLNTSHVKVKHNKDDIVFTGFVFKYISC